MQIKKYDPSKQYTTEQPKKLSIRGAQVIFRKQGCRSGGEGNFQQQKKDWRVEGLGIFMNNNFLNYSQENTLLTAIT